MYKGYGVYRFLDRDRNCIYIGQTNNIHRRIYSQHFTNRGHLPNECYSSTARVDYIKLDNAIDTQALEIYLINKYKPKFNKKDKSKDPFILNQYGATGEFYSQMENWRTYRTIRNFNPPKSSGRKLSTVENIIFYIILVVTVVTVYYLYSKYAK